MPATTLQRCLLTCTCVFLRILIVTSIYNIVVFLTSPDQPWGLKSILPFVILLHHGLSVWYLWFNPVFVDWLLISGELAAWFVLRFYTWRTDRWTMSKYIVLLGSLYVQMLALFSLWLIRSIMIQQCPSGLHSPLNLLALDYDGKNPRQNKKSWKKRLQLIFGRSLWGPKCQKFKGKHGVFLALRAILALAIFLGMLIFAIFCLIIWPASETGMVPVKTMISPGVRWDFQSLKPGWNIFVILDRDLNTSIVNALPGAVQVTPLWEDLGQQVKLCAPIGGPYQVTKPQCQFKGWKFSDDLDPSLKYNTPADVAVHSFHYFCPNRCTRDLTLLEFLEVPVRDTMPDLLVTLNFTTLGIPPLSSTVGGSRLKTVGIIVAFNDNIGDVLRVSTQTSLLPGMHLLGRVGLEFRSLIARSYLAAIGLASPSHTFIAGTVYDLTQDPASISQDTTTASLRLYVPSDRTDWRFIQEDREKSVIAGFAAIGGLWTSVTGIFSFFFGGTLALLLWGQKPLSIFGLFDKLWKKTLLEEWEGRSDEPDSDSEELHLEELNPGEPSHEEPDHEEPLNPEEPNDANVWKLDKNDWIMIKLLREKLVDLGPLEDIHNPLLE